MSPPLPLESIRAEEKAATDDTDRTRMKTADRLPQCPLLPAALDPCFIRVHPWLPSLLGLTLESVRVSCGLIPAGEGSIDPPNARVTAGGYKLGGILDPPRIKEGEPNYGQCIA
jgi:hypothetical protein